MQTATSGQCGQCTHFGEHDGQANEALVNILSKPEASAQLLEECGHPKHAALHLVVTPISGCDGFVPVAAA